MSPSKITGVTGLDEVIAETNRAVMEVENRTMSGLIRAVAMLRKDMDKVMPKIPVDTGNLRASWFVITSRGGIPSGSSPRFQKARTVKTKSGEMVEESVDIEKLVKGHVQTLMEAKSIMDTVPIYQEAIAFGFGAYYALYVHEMMNAKFKRRGAGPKYFQAAIRRNAVKMLALIIKEARMKETGYALGGTGRAVRGKIKQEFD